MPLPPPDHDADLAAALGIIRAMVDGDDQSTAYVLAVRIHAALVLDPPDLDDDEPAEPEDDPTGGPLAAATNLIVALGEIGARLALGEQLGVIALELAAREDTAS
jgi:hypothetical protein